MYLAPKGKEYLEQWERLKRWHGKVKDLDRGGNKLVDDVCLDIVHAFFLNCLNLRDWVEESVYNCEKGNPAELLFSRQNGKVCFRICADFANNLKHFKLNNSGKIDKDTKITSQGVTISAGLLTPEGVDNNFPYMTRYEWKITADGEEYDVFTLAQECINEWEKFLKNIENPTP